ncbi:hypothetical protein [Kutzneria chonburiensis]|uniref:hypothetical protein n=1 Tax=Kutzneria chonburiensis TaxID=1483604 RepID=UPI002362181D|nr:hypothetical protein [Kutzneria chonburiensis]
MSWHGSRAYQPDWSPTSRLLAMMRTGQGPDGEPEFVYVAANAHWEGHAVELPALPDGHRWHLFADTSAASPDDVSFPGREPLLDDDSSATVPGRASVVLVGRRPENRD